MYGNLREIIDLNTKTEVMKSPEEIIGVQVLLQSLGVRKHFFIKEMTKDFYPE